MLIQWPQEGNYYFSKIRGNTRFSITYLCDFLLNTSGAKQRNSKRSVVLVNPKTHISIR